MYNPSTRSCIPEPWNFEEGRRAYLKEALECMIHQLEFHRNKDSEQSGVIINLMEENKSLLEKLASTNVIMEAKDKLLKEKYAKVRSSIGVGYEEGFSASENVSNYQPINYREIVNAGVSPRYFYEFFELYLWNKYEPVITEFELSMLCNHICVIQNRGVTTVKFLF